MKIPGNRGVRSSARPLPCISRSLPIWPTLRHSLLLLTLFISLCDGDIRNNEVTDYLQRVRLKSDEPLSSFVLTSSSVFVGGTNVLYQLDSEDLIVKYLVKTGPQLDSAKCHATGCTGSTANISTVLTDNVNKALVVDSENQKLIGKTSCLQDKYHYIHNSLILLFNTQNGCYTTIVFTLKMKYVLKITIFGLKVV